MLRNYKPVIVNRNPIPINGIPVCFYLSSQLALPLSIDAMKFRS